MISDVLLDVGMGEGIRNVLFLNYVNAIGLQSFLDLIDEMTTR